jgi:hypothetical protein
MKVDDLIDERIWERDHKFLSRLRFMY